MYLLKHLHGISKIKRNNKISPHCKYLGYTVASDWKGIHEINERLAMVTIIKELERKLKTTESRLLSKTINEISNISYLKNG